MKKKKEIDIQITELFMAKAGNDFSRCFHGTIKREKDENGNPFVFSRIKVNDGYIYSRAEDQWKLGEMLDQMVVLNLDRGLHSDSGINVLICENDFFLN
jgi:hypothetical protein